MKRKNVLIFFGIALLLSGCFIPIRTTQIVGSRKVATETRDVSGFTAVDLSSVGTLIIQQGSVELLSITAEDNIFPYLKTDVVGNNLRIGVRDNINLNPHEEIIYNLTVIDLERLESSGIGKIEMGSLNTDELDVDISGASDLRILNLNARDFNLDLSGVGNVEISGSAEQQRVDLSGAGNYEAGDLKNEYARIEISGTGQAVIWAEKELDVEISGMGNLQYYGDPALITDLSGIGRLEKLTAK